MKRTFGSTMFRRIFRLGLTLESIPAPFLKPCTLLVTNGALDIVT